MRGMSDEDAAKAGGDTLHFSVDSHLLLELGERLVARKSIALAELVKNSYDADATKVSVTLDNADSATRGRIVVADDGLGMSRKKILESWLEIGTISKYASEDRKSPGGRVYLGEKGIGRFAVHKLGKRTEVTTREEGGRAWAGKGLMRSRRRRHRLRG